MGQVAEIRRWFVHKEVKTITNEKDGAFEWQEKQIFSRYKNRRIKKRTTYQISSKELMI